MQRFSGRIAIVLASSWFAFVNASEPPQPVENEEIGDSASQPSRVLIADRRSHLLEAATHLEAAGLADEAKRLRDQIRTANELLLADKLRELSVLQEEVLRLKQLTGYAEQFLVHVQLAEVDSERLRELDLKLDELAPMKASEGRTTENCLATLSSARAREVVQLLQVNRCLTMMAEPALSAVEGRPAWFASGGEVPIFGALNGEGAIGFEYHKTGVEVWLTPRGESRDRVRLETKVRYCAINHTTGIKIDETEIPGFDTREMQLSVVVGEGQSGVFLGDRRTRAAVVESAENRDQWSTLVDIVAQVFAAEPPMDAADAEPVTAQRPGETMLLLVVTPEFIRPQSQRPVPVADDAEPTD